LGEWIVVYVVTLGPIWQEGGLVYPKSDSAAAGRMGPARAPPFEHFSKKRSLKKKDNQMMSQNLCQDLRALVSRGFARISWRMHVHRLWFELPNGTRGSR